MDCVYCDALVVSTYIHCLGVYSLLQESIDKHVYIQAADWECKMWSIYTGIVWLRGEMADQYTTVSVP